MEANAPIHMLDGYKVLDFTQAVAGPTATLMLAEMGAEVIKVELMPNGDLTRAIPLIRNGRSGYFVQHNRGKKSICVDVKNPEGLAARGESRWRFDGSPESIVSTTMWRMAMGTRQSEQASLWVATVELPKSPGHPFYTRLNVLLDAEYFDRFVEGQCARFYAPVMGRPSLALHTLSRWLQRFDCVDVETPIRTHEKATDTLQA
jgi:hypothetical protein